jgi:hypothetical protein
MIYPLKFNEEETNPKHNEWFDRFINIQKIFGLTYCGYITSHNKSQSIYYLKKVLLSLYDIIIVIVALYFTLSIGFANGELNLELYKKSSKRCLSVLLFLIANFAAVVEQITYKLIIFLNGPQILSTIHSFGYYLKPMPILSKVKISLFIIIYCSLIVLAFVCSTDDLNSIIRDSRNRRFHVLFTIFGGLYCGITQTSIVVLMTFTSDLVRREINELTLNMKSNGEIGFICE